MARHKAELLVAHPLLEGHDVFRHIPYLLDRAAALNVKGIEDLLGLGADRVLVGNIIGDRPHLFPVELLGVQPHAVVKVGLVDIKVHHAGVGAADLGQIRVAEAAAHLCGAAPVGDLAVDLTVPALDDAGDDGVALAGTLKVGDHLAHGAAGVQRAEPGGRVGVGIVRRFFLLQIDEHDRDVEVAHGGQHVIGGGIGQQLQDHEIHVGGAELVARGHRELLGRDKAAVDQFDRIGDALFKVLILALKFRHEGGKLGQIGAERDGENADACFGVD